MVTALKPSLENFLDESMPLIIEREKTEGGFYVLKFMNGNISLSPIKPNLEALALAGAPMAQMLGVDSVNYRNTVYNYMSTHHVSIDNRGAHVIHHRHGCGVSHTSLRTVWETKRAQLSEETPIPYMPYDVSPKPSVNYDQTSKMIIMFKAKLRESLDSLIAKYGYDERAADSTVQYFIQNPRKRRLKPEQIYRLFMDYWRSSDKKETRIWESLSSAAGISNAAQARTIIMEYLGLPSLTETRPYFRSHKTPQKWKAFLIRAHSLPLKVTEIKALSGCPLGYGTMQRQLERIGKRPWVQQREFRGDLDRAKRIYTALDRLHSVKTVAAELAYSRVNVYEYVRRRDAAEELLRQLDKIIPSTIAQAPHQAP